jgi:hypothetical protein
MIDFRNPFRVLFPQDVRPNPSEFQEVVGIKGANPNVGIFNLSYMFFVEYSSNCRRL